MLRAKAEHSIGALWDAVGTIAQLFSPTECANCFKATGYDPDQTGNALAQAKLASSTASSAISESRQADIVWAS